MKPLLNNQSNAINHLKTKKIGALFKSPGTGKTRTVFHYYLDGKIGLDQLIKQNNQK